MNHMRTRRLSALDAVAWAGMFVFGIVMALLGAILPVVSRALSIRLEDVGTLFLVTNGAMLGASLVVGPLMDRVGMKAPLAAGAGLVGAALVAVAWAARLGELVPAVACLGFGGGLLNASTNTLVADLHDDADAKASSLNLLGVFFGFGALFLPFTVGALLSRVGLAGLLVTAAGLCAATATAAAALRFPAPKQVHGWPLADVRRFLGRPLVVTFACLLFLQSGSEFVLGGYLATFLGQGLAVGVGAASYVLAAYWASIMVARLLLAGIVPRVSAGGVVIGSALAASAGALVIGVAPSAAVAAAGVVITGLALAGTFPTVLGIAGAEFREHSGTVFGVLFTVALTGGMTMPWLAGHLAAAAGLRPVFLLVAAAFLAIAALGAVAQRCRRDSPIGK